MGSNWSGFGYCTTIPPLATATQLIFLDILTTDMTYIFLMAGPEERVRTFVITLSYHISFYRPCWAQDWFNDHPLKVVSLPLYSLLLDPVEKFFSRCWGGLSMSSQPTCNTHLANRRDFWRCRFLGMLEMDTPLEMILSSMFGHKCHRFWHWWGAVARCTSETSLDSSLPPWQLFFLSCWE